MRKRHPFCTHTALRGSRDWGTSTFFGQMEKDTPSSSSRHPGPGSQRPHAPGRAFSRNSTQEPRLGWVSSHPMTLPNYLNTIMYGLMGSRLKTKCFSGYTLSQVYNNTGNLKNRNPYSVQSAHGTRWLHTTAPEAVPRFLRGRISTSVPSPCLCGSSHGTQKAGTTRSQRRFALLMPRCQKTEIRSCPDSPISKSACQKTLLGETANKQRSTFSKLREF